MVKLYVSLLENKEYSFFAICEDCDSMWKCIKKYKNELIWDAPIGNSGQWMIYGSNPGKHPSDINEFFNSLFRCGRSKLHLRYPDEAEFKEIEIGLIPFDKILNREIDARTEIETIRSLLGL